MKKLLSYAVAFLIAFQSIPGRTGLAQQVSNEGISRRVQAYKSDVRGPYKDIRWFCTDGTFKAPQERCDEPGGVQRARYKDEVEALAKSNHIFLGQILATTPYQDFWDEGSHQSRMKQFQLEKYLRSIDRGWIFRRAQYYRGAFQAEDEEKWGVDFFQWLLADKQSVEKQYFLIRQACRDIPHKGDDNLKQNIRTTSRLISDAYPPFLDLRVKIHGQPEQSDISRIKDFREIHRTKMSATDLEMMDELIRDLETQFKPFDINALKPYLSRIPKNSELHKDLVDFQARYSSSRDPIEKISLLAAMLEKLRLSVSAFNSPDTRLAIIDISIHLEDVLFTEAASYQPSNPKEAFQCIYELGQAATACGYLETWEWEQLQPRLESRKQEIITEAGLIRLLETYRLIVEWGSGMYMAIYGDDVATYSGFEPLASGFIDEKIRASLLLQIGIKLSKLNDQLATRLPAGNRILNIEGQSAARGLNPGFARGELVVVKGAGDILEVDKDKIYVYSKPPPDLKPVAGIMTVSEGNPVSHVQLLARNLGIPNAVISMQILDELNNYAGQQVFYAVSSKGIVVLKSEQDMSADEKKLFDKKERSQERIAVPVERIDLGQKGVLNLRQVDASSSGVVCGPKAANLGQLKKLFPDKVVEGLIIPFGVFMEHLEQPMPGHDMSYWDYLNHIFEEAGQMAQSGSSDNDIEVYVLNELSLFREAIAVIRLSPSLIEELNRKFVEVFGKEMGKVPVFLRSDTNMEDLKDFTGAGLNLTLFNVVPAEAILKGITDVWASPYTERSYKWRQRYLLNPENVFPSILIIPSVDVDYSGVLITKGVGMGTSEDATAAFNMGAGGAVDGQAAETYILMEDGSNILLAPSREVDFRALPSTGGAKKIYTSFEKPILSDENIVSLRKLVKEILELLPAYGTHGPYDIELGFKDDRIWLFQVRPFVENKNAWGKLYIESLNPILDNRKTIDLNK